MYKTAKFKTLKLTNRIHNSDGKQVELVYAEIQEIGTQDEYDSITYADYKDLLTPKEFDFLMKHYIEGFTLAEMAKQEHINLGASKMRLYRILEKLRKINLKLN
jgi:DNA-directed RNA polymerase specialized sigma24 family protein